MMELSIKNRFKKALRLSEQVTEFLISEIQKGALKAGERLPPEMELARQFGVSRTVIREAFARLRQDGFLESKQGRGARVAESKKHRPFRLLEFDKISPTDLVHLYELRIILEGYAASLAAKRRRKKDLKEFKRCLEAMDKSIRYGKDGTDPDVKFHQTIAKASGNPYLFELMRFLNGNLESLIRNAREHSSQHPHLPPIVQEEHKSIYKAILEGDPDLAKAKTLTHLINAAKRLELHGFQI